MRAAIAALALSLASEAHAQQALEASVFVDLPPGTETHVVRELTRAGVRRRQRWTCVAPCELAVPVGDYLLRVPRFARDERPLWVGLEGARVWLAPPDASSVGASTLLLAAGTTLTGLSFVPVLLTATRPPDPFGVGAIILIVGTPLLVGGVAMLIAGVVLFATARERIMLTPLDRGGSARPTARLGGPHGTPLGLTFTF